MLTPGPRYDLLILGGSGFVGARLAQAAQQAGRSAACTHRTRPLPPGVPGWVVDLCDPAQVTALLRDTRPRAVIHCAVSYAPTHLDEAEQMASSAYSTRTLVDCLHALALDTRIVYVSTNAVFSGMLGRPCAETDRPDPEARHDQYRYYGLARRAGEITALEGWPDALVVRTASVDGFDAWGRLNPRLSAQVDLLRSGRPFSRYVDRVISPTLVDTLVQGLLEAAQPEFSLPQTTGRVLHLVGCEPLTDFDYAVKIAGRLGISQPPIQADHYLPPGAAGRYNIALDAAQTQALLRTRLLTVDQMLDVIGQAEGW